jgi:hypothetical protein
MAGPVTLGDIRREIDARVDRLRALGQVRDSWLPVPRAEVHVDGGYFYAVDDESGDGRGGDGTAYLFGAWERGEEFDRRTTSSLDELLYWCLDSVVVVMASEWEVTHRRAGEDSRRQLFARRLELMAAVDGAWAARLRGQLDRVLERNPYDDSLVGWSSGTVRAVRITRRRWRRQQTSGALELVGNDDRVREARGLVAQLARGAGVPEEGARPGADGARATYEFHLDGRRLVVPEEQLTPELRRLAELVLADPSRR